MHSRSLPLTVILPFHSFMGHTVQNQILKSRKQYFRFASVIPLCRYGHRIFWTKKILWRKRVSFRRKKRTMYKWNGSFNEMKNQRFLKRTKKYDWKSFERTWKNDCFINERTNFAKDLEKLSFLLNELFIRTHFFWMLVFYWKNDFPEQMILLNILSVRKRKS